MLVKLLAALLCALVAVMLVICAKALISTGWFFKWLRGTVGFIFLTGAFLGAIVAADLFTYFIVDEGKVIATLSFSKKSPQLYDAELVDADGHRHHFEIAGDQWQLDAKLMDVSIVLENALPAYKLDRLSGRYLSLEQEQTDIRSVHGLSESRLPDTWNWFNETNLFPFISAKYGSAAFMPMVDGGIFQVLLVQDGLKAEPTNSKARLAVESW